MNLRVVGVPGPHPTAIPTRLRVVDLDDLDQAMNGDDRVLGPDGRQLGHRGATATAEVGRPTEADIDFALDHADRMLMFGYSRPESMFVQLAAEVRHLRAALAGSADDTREET